MELNGIYPFPKNPHFLVDGDIVAYRASAAAEKTKYLVQYQSGTYAVFDDAFTAKKSLLQAGDLIWSRKDLKDPYVAEQICSEILKGISENFPENTMTVYLSGERNFRDLIWKTKKYKGNRNVPKPTHLSVVQEYLRNNWPTVDCEGEADDKIASDYFTYAANFRAVIASIDKDLDQIPGWHYDWVKKESYFVTRKDADVFLCEQIISGDSTDNVPGIDGMGPAKARAAMAGVKSIKDAMYRLRRIYSDKGLSEDYFMEQAELVYIRRNHLDFRTYFNEYLNNE